MVCTLRRTLAVALAVLCVASVVALAADTTVVGTIQHIDPTKGHLTLRSEEGKTVQLQAPAALLSSLQAGDAVEVKVAGQKATLIHRLGSEIQQRRPDGTRRSE
jgi:hypothetical protein